MRKLVQKLDFDQHPGCPVKPGAGVERGIDPERGG
jgi:hypothetical protein